MKPHMLTAHLTIRYLAMAALLIAALMFVLARPAAQVGSRSTEKTDVFSFDMWCLEMQLYPAARCDARRSDDIKAYERYRAMVEQYAEQRTLRENRDRELKGRLNREPANTQR